MADDHEKSASHFLKERKTIMNEIGCYIHIPFCDHKCIYCDFYSIISTENSGLFLDALKKEIKFYAEKYSDSKKIKTIFFGGGTPSLMTPEFISEILLTLNKYFTIPENAEITLETNPGTVNANKLNGFRETGINRLSVGVQSFDDDDLKFLTRIHNKETAVKTIEDAYASGIENISVDLIFNLPGQTKEKWNETGKRIVSFMVHKDNEDSVGEGVEKDRNWVVQQFNNGKTFCCIHLGEDGKWYKGSEITHINGGLNWKDNLPYIQTKRKMFISYYHKEDQAYKEKFKNLTSDLIINKSVEDGDISADVKDEYIKQLIQKGFLSDTTVLIVLIGNKTKCRKHIDWEISGALNLKVGDSYAGLLGLKLPNHPDYGTGKSTYDLMPARLADNFKSGYAIIRDYTTDRKKLQEYIELAYKNRTKKADKRTNSRPQMQRNTCE